MAVLVFKKNEKESQDVSEVVVEKYYSLYVDKDDIKTAKNLLNLITGASLTELFCYEEIIKRFCKEPKFLNPKLVKALWYEYQLDPVKEA